MYTCFTTRSFPDTRGGEGGNDGQKDIIYVFLVSFPFVISFDTDLEKCDWIFVVENKFTCRKIALIKRKLLFDTKNKNQGGRI